MEVNLNILSFRNRQERWQDVIFLGTIQNWLPSKLKKMSEMHTQRKMICGLN